MDIMCVCMARGSKMVIILSFLLRFLRGFSLDYDCL